MNRVLTRVLPLASALIAILVVAVSIYFDIGARRWAWFQRSGSLVVLSGAILGYRSIIRLGISGVGGVNPNMVTGKLRAVDDSDPVQKVDFVIDESSRTRVKEADYDKVAGFFDALFIIIGTLIWGYGDLVGLLLH